MKGVLAVALLLLGGCAHRVECVTHGGPVWRELRTQHFLVLTDLPVEQARLETLDLEEQRLAIRWYFGLAAEDDDFTDVLLLRDGDELLEFLDVAGFANTSDPPEAGFVVSAWAPPKSWRRGRTIPHELAHRYSSEVFPLSDGWVEEGTAAYLETVRLEGPWAARFGGVGDRFYFDGRPLDLEQLWALPPFFQLTGDRRNRAYASAWLYVHYLTNHEPARWQQFNERRRKERDPQVAFEQVFPRAGWPELDAKIIEHKNQARFRVQNVQVQYERRLVSESEVPAWRVHLVRRLLTLHGDAKEPEKARRASAEAQLARNLGPRPVPWLVEEALAGSDNDARRAAAANHPGEYLAEIELGRAALERRDYSQAQARGREALAARPTGPTAHLIVGLAQLYLGQVEAAAPSLERAQRLAPWSFDSAVALSRLRAAQGRCADAEGWLARLRGLGADSSATWGEFERGVKAQCETAARSKGPTGAAGP